MFEKRLMQSAIQMINKIAQAENSKKKQKHCQCTIVNKTKTKTTAIQMIKRILTSSKLEQLPQKIGTCPSVSKLNRQLIHSHFEYVSQG